MRKAAAYDVNSNVTNGATNSLQTSYNLLNFPAQTKSGITVKANYSYLSDGTKASVLNASGAGYDYNGTFTYSHASGGTRALESVAFGIALDDFGARRYDRTAWTSIDPLAEKYYNVSPYAYCFNSPDNYVDPDGCNPIFDQYGNFIGVDDRGFSDMTPFFVNPEDYYYGISHDEASSANSKWILDNLSSSARSNFIINYLSLLDRPDLDGIVTASEGIAWAKDHKGAKNAPTPKNTLFIDSSKINLGYFKDDNDSNDGFMKTNLFNLPNMFSSLFNRNIRSTAYALGRFDYRYLDNKSELQIITDDATVYDWNTKGGILRTIFVYFERIRNGLGNDHGFNTYYYGTYKTSKNKK